MAHIEQLVQKKGKKIFLLFEGGKSQSSSKEIAREGVARKL